MTEKGGPSEKRLDLQGIRGIAIISVIGFHFLPSCFPNGYVGVDQFFVLSGFLMCMLLRKSYHNPSFSSYFQWISNFYIRRLKRIAPLYFLLILVALLPVFTIFPYTAVDANLKSGRKALFFVSNQGNEEEGNYFEMLSLAIDVFTHTWSLSVEVQFYIFVPFLYLLGAKLGNNLELLCHVAIGLLSFLYSKFYCTPEEAFNSVPARVWQFSIGMMAHLLVTSKESESYTLLTDNEEEPKEDSTTNYKYFLTVLIITLPLFPLEIPHLRPFLTLLTGILMVLPTNFILESRFLTYSGDVSYSLYLIHWPIYAYWKLKMSHGDVWNWQWLLAIAASISLAIICFETFEKWYLKQSNQFLFILSLLLFSSNLGLLYQREVLNWISPPEKTDRLDGLKDGEVVGYGSFYSGITFFIPESSEKAERLNRLWNIEDLANINAPTCGNGVKMVQDCEHTGLDPNNGKYKLMIIGNSWAGNHGRLFYEECHSKASSIIERWRNGCEPLYPQKSHLEQCNQAIQIFEDKLKEHHPDYLFIFSRFMEIGDPIQGNLTVDPVYQRMKSQLEVYTKLVKRKVFIMDQIAEFTMHQDQIAKEVMERKDLVEFDLFLNPKPFQKSLVARHPEMARQRYQKLASECSKCELFDYKPLFFNRTTNTWRFYDEANSGLTYLTTTVHLSFHGLELVRPVIRDLCRSL
uniref:Acyl_transf_3 domain-containing protein n=1 Tax=Caenorhabditis tropicalis TaxID=1561998 RepID=A0A1I7TH44_9PELO